MLLEVISNCPQDCRIIEGCGASRIQLVSALQIGGLTPSHNIIRRSIQSVDILIMIMIRHHNQGFIYSEDQKILMIDEIIHCKQMGVKGLVIGALNKSRQVQEGFLEQVEKNINNKIDVTFHKASDQTPNLIQTYEILSKYKWINHLLTQGGSQPILSNTQIIKRLRILNKRPKILLGGGINHKNIIQIAKTLHPQQMHVGTCVRKNKYGPIDSQKLVQLLKLIS